MIVEGDELQEFLDNTESFIQEAERAYTGCIVNVGEDIKEMAKECLPEDYLQAKRLGIAILYFIQKCKSGVKGNSSESIGDRLALLVNYYQSIGITEELILSGQYIAASALMKQDFETMVRVKETRLGRAKKGKTPNANSAPEGLRKIYGQLNDVAHISKNHVIGFYLESPGDEGDLGVSASPQFKNEQFVTFYIYHICIMYEVVSEAVGLYKEMYGMDDGYKTIGVYHRILTSLMKEIDDAAMAQIKKEEE